MDTSPPQSLPDLAGEEYDAVLDRLHHLLRPRSYLEIGTLDGKTLRHARCATIAVDPKFQLESAGQVTGKPVCALYQMASDTFFSEYNPRAVLGRSIDFAFIDGMHLSEYVLRDFLNTEKYCHRDSVIAIHDCVPLDYEMANRDPDAPRRETSVRRLWWVGDVWRVLLLLKRRRPDLKVAVMSAPPTGLGLVTNLSPESTFLSDNYNWLVEEMHAMSLAGITLPGLHAALSLQPTSSLEAWIPAGLDGT